MHRALLMAVLAATAALAGCASTAEPGPGTDADPDAGTTTPGPSRTPGATGTSSPSSSPSPSPSPSQTPSPTPTGGPEPPTDGPKTPAWAEVGSAALRPGMRSQAGDSLCTFDFLFFDPQSGDYFVGLAGHCTANEGQQVLLADSGALVGTVVFDSDLDKYQGTGIDVEWLDFTLVRLEPGMNLKAHPQMMEHDGPRGFVRQGEPSLGDTTAIHGHGLLLGDLGPTRSREGVLMFMNDHWGSDMPTVFGDSGGPVLHVDTGKALGIVSGIRCCDMPPSTSYGPTVEWILEQLPLAGFPDVELALMDGTTVGLTASS